MTEKVSAKPMKCSNTAEIFRTNEALNLMDAKFEAMVERLSTDIHSCHDQCQRPLCVMTRRAETAEAELLALRARVEAAPMVEAVASLPMKDGSTIRTWFDGAASCSIGQRVRLLTDAPKDDARKLGGGEHG